MPGEYLLRSGYQAREGVSYFDDEPLGVTYQPEVYTNTARLARTLGCRRLIDLGCGNGEKLAALAHDLEVVGIDIGTNIDRCRKQHAVGSWVEYDLMETGDSALPVRVDGAAIVCADVIEHVSRPDLLVRKLVVALETARLVVISTPERDLRHGARNHGPPPNPAHAREWTVRELGAFLRRQGLEHGSLGLTRSNDRDNLWYTILGVYVATDADLAVVEDVLIDAPVPSLPEPVDVQEPHGLNDADGLLQRIAKALVRRAR